MKTCVVSGGASGIGAATASRLRTDGHRVITVDLHDADVVADLSTPAGRHEAVAGVQALLGPDQPVHGLVPAAGIGGFTGVDPALLMSVNFFGAVALVEGLRPQLAAAQGAGVVFLASNSITGQPGWDSAVAGLCLRGDETAVREAAAKTEAVMVYPASKAALAWWARREGVKPEWIGAGIRMNSVAPGKIATPMVDQLMADPVFGPLSEAYPSAIGRDGTPEEVAAAIAFLLSDEASLIVGSVLYVDGGTDAILHPVSPDGWETAPVEL